MQQQQKRYRTRPYPKGDGSLGFELVDNQTAEVIARDTDARELDRLRRDLEKSKEAA